VSNRKEKREQSGRAFAATSLTMSVKYTDHNGAYLQRRREEGVGLKIKQEGSRCEKCKVREKGRADHGNWSELMELKPKGKKL